VRLCFACFATIGRGMGAPYARLCERGCGAKELDFACPAGTVEVAAGAGGAVQTARLRDPCAIAALVIQRPPGANCAEPAPSPASINTHHPAVFMRYRMRDRGRRR